MNIEVDQQEQIRSAFEQLVAAMCEHPEDVTVRLLPSNSKPVITVRCNSVDYGAVLGKRQSMLLALKLLARTMGARCGLDADLYLDEQMVPSRGVERRKFEPAEEWDGEPLEKLATLFCCQLLGGCQVAVAQVSSTTSRVTVTATGNDWVPDEDQADKLEEALGLAFNCVGSMQGQRILVEVVV